jgi:hypothetical protein
MTQFPPHQPPTYAPSSSLAPHHGTAILVMGILSLTPILCGFGWILGLIAWIMGHNELREVDAGRMDPTGRGNIQAGKVCGMISVILHAACIGIYLLLFMLGLAGAIFSAGRP